MPDAEARPGAAGAVLAGLTAALLLLPAGTAAQTILNIERLQPGDVSGWHTGVEGSFSFADGNTDKLEVISGVILGYQWEGGWLRAFGGFNYLSEDDDPVENDRYLHLRYNRRLAERWRSFHFAQIQASRTKRLERRVLLGSGIRRRLVQGERTTFDVGTGVMWEDERLDAAQVEGGHPVESEVWRMANLFVATRQLTESVRLLGVAYVQPDLSDFGDTRTLADASLVIDLTEQVALTIRGEWRHDSRPPDNVETDDVSLSTGFAVTFR